MKTKMLCDYTDVLFQKHASKFKENMLHKIYFKTELENDQMDVACV